MNLDLALHDIVTGVVEAGHHHLIDSEKLALLNGENHVLEVGLGGRRGGSDVERSIGKSAVEVKVENSFPICSQILFGVGLAGLGFEHWKLILADQVCALYFEITNSPLGSFFDVQVNREMGGHPLIVVVHFSFDLCLAKSVGAVKGLQHRDVIPEQGPAVTPVCQKASGRLHQHARTNVFGAEITGAAYSRKLDQYHLVRGAGVDQINHSQSLGIVFPPDFDFGVEVPPSLEVVEQVALAFVDEVVVQRVFFVNRNL